MATRGATVVAVDVDPAMAELTSEAVAGLPNVRVLHRDALYSKHMINTEVLDAVRSGLSAGSGRRFKLVANLPYNIATPLITNLLVHPELCPALMVVTIQRELADRLVARPSSAAYGAVSVLVSGRPGELPGSANAYDAGRELAGASAGGADDRRGPDLAGQGGDHSRVR